MLPEKVLKVGLKRERGWIYFVDKEEDISRARNAPKKERLYHA